MTVWSLWTSAKNDLHLINHKSDKTEAASAKMYSDKKPPTGRIETIGGFLFDKQHRIIRFSTRWVIT